jgi:hypothetical protein
VLAGDVGIRLVFGPRRPRDRAVIEGMTGESLVPLKDGRFLRFSVALFLEPHDGGSRLKIEKSVYQYQSDEPGDRWIVRYDYLRYPDEPHPGMHVQIRGALHETAALRPGHTLERVHFPTGRVSMEAIIRLLIEQFHVPTNNAPDVWRPILAESEGAFLRIAHQQISGPAA